MGKRPREESINSTIIMSEPFRESSSRRGTFSRHRQLSSSCARQSTAVHSVGGSERRHWQHSCATTRGRRLRRRRGGDGRSFIQSLSAAIAVSQLLVLISRTVSLTTFDDAIIVRPPITASFPFIPTRTAPRHSSSSTLFDTEQISPISFASVASVGNTNSTHVDLNLLDINSSQQQQKIGDIPMKTANGGNSHTI